MGGDREQEPAVSLLPRERQGAAVPVPAPAVVPAPALVSELHRGLLFGLAGLLLVFVAGFAGAAYWQESSFYDLILSDARKSAACAENAMLFEVALAPFRSLSMVRTAGLFLSFVMVLLGSLFVLTGIEAAYRISLSNGEKKAALETASPGLVLATAGRFVDGGESVSQRFAAIRARQLRRVLDGSSEQVGR